jgi:hypothetical protein
MVLTDDDRDFIKTELARLKDELNGPGQSGWSLGDHFIEGFTLGALVVFVWLKLIK